MRVPELTATFNKHFNQDKTPQQIKSALSNHKFTCGRNVGNPKGTCLIYTPEQVKWLRENVTGHSHADIASMLNETFNDNKTAEQIKSYLSNHGLNTGRTGCFEKGMKPWNTGTKGVVKPNSGNFKKGTVPSNCKPLWSERICSKDGFILMKVPERDPHTGFPTRHKHKHVWLWEQANGPVPEGMAVVFIDSDKLNCVLENLMLVSRAELLSLNLLDYKNKPAELKQSVLALAKLEAKARFRTSPARGRGKNKKSKGATQWAE